MNTLEWLDKQEPLEISAFIAEHEPLNIPKPFKPLPAGLGISWSPSGGEHWKTWQNTCTFCGETGEYVCEQKRVNNAPPSRQVQSSNAFSVLGQLGDTVLEHEPDCRDQKSAHLPPDLQGYHVSRDFNVTVEELELKPKPKGMEGQGRQNRHNREQQRYQTYTVQDLDDSEVLGKMQPEIQIGVDCSLFTQTTDPHNPRHIKEILKHMSIGPDLTTKQHDKVVNLLTEFADCFALSISEVIPIPGTKHHIHVLPDTTFLKKIPYQ